MVNMGKILVGNAFNAKAIVPHALVMQLNALHVSLQDSLAIIVAKKFVRMVNGVSFQAELVNIAQKSV